MDLGGSYGYLGGSWRILEGSGGIVLNPMTQGDFQNHGSSCSCGLLKAIGSARHLDSLQGDIIGFSWGR